MSSEIGSVDVDELGGYNDWSRIVTDAPVADLYSNIFVPKNHCCKLPIIVTVQTGLSHIEKESQKVAQIIAPMGKVSGEAGITFEWGGSNGSEVSGYVSGGASDDKGNKAEVKVEVKSDGSGNATVAVSHDKDSGSQK